MKIIKFILIMPFLISTFWNIAFANYVKLSFINSKIFTDGQLHIFFCGTGGPNTSMQEIRKPACLAVISDNQFLVFDAGEGADQTLASLGLPLNQVGPIFITHWHSDHFAGLGDLINASWRSHRQKPLIVYGPDGVKTVISGINQAFSLDILFRSLNRHGRLNPKLGKAIPKLINTTAKGKKVYHHG